MPKRYHCRGATRNNTNSRSLTLFKRKRRIYCHKKMVGGKRRVICHTGRHLRVWPYMRFARTGLARRK